MDTTFNEIFDLKYSEYEIFAKLKYEFTGDEEHSEIVSVLHEQPYEVQMAVWVEADYHIAYHRGVESPDSGWRNKTLLQNFADLFPMDREDLLIRITGYGEEY